MEYKAAVETGTSYITLVCISNTLTHTVEVYTVVVPARKANVIVK